VELVPGGVVVTEEGTGSPATPAARAARPQVSIPRDGEPLPAGGGLVLPIGRLR
jgi:hypothetical protein